jgi:hypothetical protein
MCISSLQKEKYPTKMPASVKYSDRHLLYHYSGCGYKPTLCGAEKQIINLSSNLTL